MKNLIFTLALLISFSSFGQTEEDINDLYKIAMENFGKQKFDKAIEDLSKIIELDSKHPALYVAYEFRGESLAQLGYYNKAILDYTKSIEIDHPNISMTYYYRGLCYSKIGDWDSFCADLKKSIELGIQINGTKDLELEKTIKNYIDEYCN
jgi:tetratricopeptide (TPR) repeat protein